VIPINYLKPFSSSAVMDLTHKPDNVHVYETPVFYIPTDRGYKKLSRDHYYSAEKVIRSKKLRFDFIHAHIIVSAGYAGAMLKEKHGVPLVVTAHGIDIYDTPFRDEEWRQQTEYVLNSADQIITVSNKNLSCINKLDVKTPVTVIPNGYRKDIFYPRDSKECRSELNLPQDKKIIVTVGKLFPIKGQAYLIDAIGEIVKRRKDLLCVIIGDGELREKLKKRIKDRALEQYILMAGGRPHSEIPTWINACDIFVLPSLNEGNPTVMFECLGCGKPFIGTRVGGIPEIMTSEDYGYVIPPANAEELAQKMEMALDRSWDRERIYRYASNYTWEKIANDITGVYKKLWAGSVQDHGSGRR
jgi:glycosyltransferase involved in cell wall biosynthesis